MADRRPARRNGQRTRLLVASGTLVALLVMPDTQVSAATTTGVLVGAGDIADCSISADEATARLLDAIPGTVFAAGDNVYGAGSLSQYGLCYGPSWGRYRWRTYPVPGNHDYYTSDAAGYFKYFSSRIRSHRYYAYDLGPWRIYALNSNCRFVGCSAGTAQERWLRADLRAYPHRCVLAYWHHPRFSSGSHGSSTATAALWKALSDYRAEVVLSGHDHDYERFAPQTSAGALDRTRGIRQFVVGTGGEDPRPFATIRRNSEVRNSTTHGVLKLVLSATGYSWQFVPVAGKSFKDSGTTACH